MICGEVWRVSLAVPPGDTHGREAEAIVVQDAAYGRGSPMVLVAPLSEDPNAVGFPGTVPIEPDSGNGIATMSTALVFQLRALDRARFVSKLGSVREDVLNEVMGEVDRLTGRTPKAVD
jgi:mRNA interferase MazF